jgi:hypothetical protein
MITLIRTTPCQRFLMSYRNDQASEIWKVGKVGKVGKGVKQTSKGMRNNTDLISNKWI